MSECTNTIVRNAVMAHNAPDWGSAAAWLAGGALSDAQRRKNEEAKRKAETGIGQAVRGLRGSASIFDMLSRSGGNVNGVPADVAAAKVQESIGILAKFFGV